LAIHSNHYIEFGDFPIRDFDIWQSETLDDTEFWPLKNRNSPGGKKSPENKTPRNVSISFLWVNFAIW
jgi:hypothetical protein